LPLDHDIFGEGIYTPREAARLIGCSPIDVRRWTRGNGTTEALWNGYFQDLDDAAEINFADLIELKTVFALRKVSSLQAIRYAYDLAQKTFEVERPFLTLSFKTDGNEILVKSAKNEEDLTSLSKKHPTQRAFGRLIEQSLKDLEYEGGKVARWRPSIERQVVVDPARSFGAPVLDNFGVSTRTLFEEYEEFEDLSYLSNIYEIPKKNVYAAIKFEQKLDEGLDGQSSF